MVGCGRVSRNHFYAIKALNKEFELVSFCETDTKAREDCKRELNIPCYSDLENMLVTEKLDLVSLCTPSGIHPQQTILSAKHKVHILTEKLMATRWSDGKNMVKACDEAGVRLFVVKQNRFNSTLQLLKKAIEQKRFGKIHLVNVNVFLDLSSKLL